MVCLEGEQSEEENVFSRETSFLLLDTFAVLLLWLELPCFHVEQRVEENTHMQREEESLSRLDWFRGKKCDSSLIYFLQKWEKWFPPPWVQKTPLSLVKAIHPQWKFDLLILGGRKNDLKHFNNYALFKLRFQNVPVWVIFHRVRCGFAPHVLFCVRLPSKFTYCACAGEYSFLSNPNTVPYCFLLVSPPNENLHLSFYPRPNCPEKLSVKCLPKTYVPSLSWLCISVCVDGNP